MVFLIIWGFAHGYSARSLYDILLSISVLSLFIVLPRVFNYKSIELFNRVIFIFCLFHTIVSIIDIFTKGSITNLLIFNRQASTASVWSEDLVRLTGGIGIAFYTFVIGLYYLASRKERYNPWFLWLVVFFSWFFILNTATRGWMIASLFLFFSFSLFYFNKILTKNRVLIGAIIMIIGVFLLPNSVRQNLNAAFERLSTVESIAEGDMTAGGTTRRWDVRGPRVLSRFHESPVFGFGFSKVTSEHWDIHVGNHIVLLMGGVLGLAIIWLTVLSIIIFIYHLEQSNVYYKGIFVFGLALASILIIHSTNMLMISYVRMPAHSILIITMLFNHINAQLYQFKNDSSLISGRNQK